MGGRKNGLEYLGMVSSQVEVAVGYALVLAEACMAEAAEGGWEAVVVIGVVSSGVEAAEGVRGVWAAAWEAMMAVAATAVAAKEVVMAGGAAEAGRRRWPRRQ